MQNHIVLNASAKILVLQIQIKTDLVCKDNLIDQHYYEMRLHSHSIDAKKAENEALTSEASSNAEVDASLHSQAAVVVVVVVAIACWLRCIVVLDSMASFAQKAFEVFSHHNCTDAEVALIELQQHDFVVVVVVVFAVVDEVELQHSLHFFDLHTSARIDTATEEFQQLQQR
jgi:hypothetical protein